MRTEADYLVPATRVIEPAGVLLVDAHESARRGVRLVLDECSSLRVVGEAATARDGLAEIRRLGPDLVVMELQFPDASGVAACRAIRFHQPGAKIVIFTAVTREDELMSAVLAGAAGYVFKDCRPGELIDTVLSVLGGGSVLKPAMTMRVLDLVRDLECPHDGERLVAALTPQEDLILTLVGDGLSNREIADYLSLREATVANYLSTVYAKLNVQRRSQAVRLVTEHRIRRLQAPPLSASGPPSPTVS